MASPARGMPVFELSGGALCLDFVNTLGDRPRCHNDLLADYGTLLGWAGQAGVLDHREARRLEQLAVREPRRARLAFRRAIELREVLYRTFSALASATRPAEEDLAALNDALAAALRFLRVEQASEGFGWSWFAPDARLDRVLWPVARSAADLLTSAESSYVRECGSRTCSWLFVDRSRTRRRRWCDMKTCGNRAKARRHYQRKRKGSS